MVLLPHTTGTWVQVSAMFVEFACPPRVVVEFPSGTPVSTCNQLILVTKLPVGVVLWVDGISGYRKWMYGSLWSNSLPICLEILIQSCIKSDCREYFNPSVSYSHGGWQSGWPQTFGGHGCTKMGTGTSLTLLQTHKVKPLQAFSQPVRSGKCSRLC